jgi:hypothetical protein
MRSRQPTWQALQIGLEQQVATDAQVQIKRDLLEYHADVAQGRAGAAAQRVAGDLDLAFVGGKQARQDLE